MRPNSHDQILRQPLYLNPFVQSKTGRPLGTERKSQFRTWASKGINAARNIWNDTTKTFLPHRELFWVTKSRLIRWLRPEIIRACSEMWNLNAGLVPVAGAWLTHSDAQVPELYFHLIDQIGPNWRARVFTRDHMTHKLVPWGQNIQIIATDSLRGTSCTKIS